MTKKHFIAIAAVMASTADTKQAVWNTIVDRLADMCATFNPAFDRERFLTACRGESSHEG